MLNIEEDKETECSSTMVSSPFEVGPELSKKASKIIFEANTLKEIQRIFSTSSVLYIVLSFLP